LGCTKDQKVEAPKQERVEKNLVPPKAEVTGKIFAVVLSDLKVSMMVDTASKEIVDTPNLRENIKITNKTKGLLDIQAVTLEYLDEAGKPIAYKSEEKIARFIHFGGFLNQKKRPKEIWIPRSQGMLLKQKLSAKYKSTWCTSPLPLAEIL